jgi:hypothetical protein
MTALKMWVFTLLAAASAAFAASALAQNASATDQTGQAQLGVDISKAGTTPSDNKNFVQNLPSDQQASVTRACVVVVNATAPQPAPVVAFCKNIGMP